MKEHGKIRSMLVELEKTSDFDLKKRLFNKFKWNLEKHFFVEEKVIFGIYDNEENINNLNKILKDHKDIILLIKKAEELLEEGHLNIFDVKTLVDAHSAFEDQVLYPQLDEKLDETQKQLILERTSEIIKE